VNKTASRGKGLALFESVLPYIKEKLKDRDITVYITQCAGDGIKLAKKLIEEKNNLIVACGGDGTNHEVLNAIMQSKVTNIALGFLPLGKSNLCYLLFI
jgi:diacylglycerol kinase (ATP)